jgi:cell wall-associated NlpC family hydrolase
LNSSLHRRRFFESFLIDRILKKQVIYLFSFALWFITACSHSRNIKVSNSTEIFVSGITLKDEVATVIINTGKTKAGDLVDFAETFLGVPYKYGGTEPKTGFDCSGFIGYVFQHFGIRVPRTSVSFTNAGETVKASHAKRGDLILFTGSDANSGKVGHMGIITDVRKDDLQFIHSASGNNKGVMISSMNNYFRERFVKVIRVF